MTSLAGILALAISVSVSSALAADDSPAQKKADQKFAALLASAKKDPKKTDWKGLRHAFAATSQYNPSDLWDDELNALEDSIENNSVQKAELFVNKLLEREGFMRLDALKVASAFYEKAGQKENARLCNDFINGISATLMGSGLGFTADKPIEVLFLEEQDLVLETLKWKGKSRKFMNHDGHHLNVITPDTDANKNARTLYFNLDLPLEAMKKTDKLPDDKDLPDLDK
jgi:hypothetical protein